MKYCIWNVTCGKRFSDFMTYEECIEKIKNKEVPEWMTTCIPNEDTVKEWTKNE